MKKIIISILFSLFTITASAQHEILEGDVYYQDMPTLCSTPEKVQAYIDHMGMKPYHISLGREGMKPDGTPVFMITYFVNEETHQNAVVIDVPSGLERCLIFHTFDVTTVQ